MKVFLNTTKNKDDPRKLVEVKVIEDKATTLIVELPDGNIITRRKNRDLPKKEEK